MARFYGRIQGGRGEATRLGNAQSGLTVTAQTWGESFAVKLWANDENVGKKDEIKRDYGSVHLGGFCLFHGDTEQLKTEEGRVKWLADILLNKPLCAKVLHELALRGLLKESER